MEPGRDARGLAEIAVVGPDEIGHAGFPRCWSNHASVRVHASAEAGGVERRPLVAVEPVLRAFVADDLGRDAGCDERGAQCFDVLDRDAPIGVAEESQPWSLELSRVLHERRELREPARDDATAVEPDGRAERSVHGREERDPTTEAEATVPTAPGP